MGYQHLQANPPGTTMTLPGPGGQLCCTSLQALTWEPVSVLSITARLWGPCWELNLLRDMKGNSKKKEKKSSLW